MHSDVTIVVEPEDSAEARQCVAAYFAELDLRFDGGFNPASGGYAGSRESPAAKARFLLMRAEGLPVGCGALKLLDGETGEIKRMWIAPEVRGRGLARRLLAALEDEARAMGIRKVRLDTNRALAEARSLYLKTGYREIDRYNDNGYADFFFEKDLS
jgi:GNAT superfamily N-acetyltransferase